MVVLVAVEADTQATTLNTQQVLVHPVKVTMGVLVFTIPATAGFRLAVVAVRAQWDKVGLFRHQQETAVAALLG